MKNKKRIIIIICSIIGSIFIIFCMLVGFFLIRDLNQENLLKREIINFSNKDFESDDFRVEVITKGDYAYVEEASKKYYKKIADNVQLIDKYINSKEFLNILTADNFENDGPNFVNSFNDLDIIQKKIKKAIKNLTELCTKEAILKMLDKEKVDEYYVDLYKKLMYTEKDLENLKKTKEKTDEIAGNLDLFINKVRETLQFLKNNQGSWYIDGENIYIENDEIANKYNELIAELNKIVKERFIITESDSSNI